MIQKEIKKKSYLKPEAEVTWMDNEEVMVTGSTPGQPWDDAKRNNISFMMNEEEEQQEDDSWGLYFSCNYDE